MTKLPYKGKEIQSFTRDHFFVTEIQKSLPLLKIHFLID